MKNILMIAFHYPPFAGGSGIHRTLKFSRYLLQFGWRPIILSAHARAYSQTGTQQLDEIPPEVVVKRAFALDTSRHLSIGGRYLKPLALPDRWVSWFIGAVPFGLQLIRQYQPAAIWSTYPIATAHLIGYVLKKLTGLPWIADFRDSMTEENYPRDPQTRRAYQWIEKKALDLSARSVFTTPSTRTLYLDRYSWLSSQKCLVIPNGFDEQDFLGLFASPDRANPQRRIRLVHAGVVYPEERDPRPFFEALARLKAEGLIDANTLRIEFRGSGSEELYSMLLKKLNITDIMHLLPALPYRESLKDCARADGLLLLQGSSCNHQIPAKAYEYLRLHKPVLALTDQHGDTAALMNECGGATICDLHDVNLLYHGVLEFLSRLKAGNHPIAQEETVKQYSRKSQAQELATHLHRVTEHAS